MAAGTFKPDDAKAPVSADDVQVGGTHYKEMAIQPWALMEVVLTPQEFIGFLKGNYIKYAMRAGRKDGSKDDLEKALHYEMKLKEMQAKYCINDLLTK